LPADLDWKSLADPATTTAVFMPTRTLAALAEKAIAEGLAPDTPAIAISRATRPDQAVVAAAVGELPGLLEASALPGPVLVMIGRALKSRREPSAAAEVRTAAKL
jgi:uroporphyrin-III C-methyltransferase/precorrin-2 dehydrogenase/sirohydrochlorin ferrochelatase